MLKNDKTPEIRLSIWIIFIRFFIFLHLWNLCEDIKNICYFFRLLFLIYFHLFTRIRIITRVYQTTRNPNSRKRSLPLSERKSQELSRNIQKNTDFSLKKGNVSATWLAQEVFFPLFSSWCLCSRHGMHLNSPFKPQKPPK